MFNVRNSRPYLYHIFNSVFCLQGLILKNVLLPWCILSCHHCWGQKVCNWVWQKEYGHTDGGDDHGDPSGPEQRPPVGLLIITQKFPTMKTCGLAKLFKATRWRGLPIPHIATISPCVTISMTRWKTMLMMRHDIWKRTLALGFLSCK
jgi:hypothetical protein